MEIKEVTVRYFKWLKKFLAKPCERLGVHDLGIVPVRLCVPAFDTRGHASNSYSPSEELLMAILDEAGWTCDDERPIVTEPETNAIGIYTQGKNVTWAPNGQRAKKNIHFLRMFGFGGYLEALRGRSLRGDKRANYFVLVIDIGAFTTDLALLDFDLDDEQKPPSILCESQALGIQELDQSVLSSLPENKSALITGIDARKREGLKRSLYVDEASYRLEGDITIGTEDELQAVRECIQIFANRVHELMNRFLRENRITRLDEVILTGGGNLITRLCASLIDAVLSKKLSTRLIHSPMEGQKEPNPHYSRQRLDSQLVRGSSSIGGASVYFEPRYW